MLGCMPDDEKIKLRYSPEESARLIKEEARRLGFSACGFAEAQALPPSVVGTYEKFLSEGRHGEMDYLERNRELRYSPAELLPGTRTVISVALNYYPKIKQPASAPQIAYYAYGKDYHKVVKRRLDKLLDYIRREVCPSVSGRSFSDSAPIAERYWACRAGIGWVGRSGMLILPRGGTFFFLGELLVDIDLPPDAPMPSRCGACRNCIESCPTGAISEEGMDSRLCVSYLTIEHEGGRSLRNWSVSWATVSTDATVASSAALGTDMPIQPRSRHLYRGRLCLRSTGTISFLWTKRSTCISSPVRLCSEPDSMAFGAMRELWSREIRKRMSSRLTKTDNGSNYECPWGKRFLSLLESLTFLVILIT